MEKNILAHSGMGQDNKIAMFVVCVLLWLAQLVVYESGSRQQGIDIHSTGGGGLH